MFRADRLHDMRSFAALAGGVLVFLYAPIVLLIVFSFNESPLITVWGGFSVEWYLRAFDNVMIQRAALNSVIVAIAATTAATILATMAVLAGAYHRTRKESQGFYILMGLPLLVPEIITAVATLSFFSLAGIRLGLGNVVLAHIVFCLPFAWLPIRARMAGIDPRLVEAARDLYAGHAKVFVRVLLPLLQPGIMSGAALAFIVSLDDFIITSMVAPAGSTTLPVYIYSMIRRGITPEVNAVSSVLLLVSIMFVALSWFWGRGRPS